MKTLIADKFSEAHIQRLSKLGCQVAYQPSLTAAELPALVAPYKILVVRGKQVTADTLNASNQLALVFYTTAVAFLAAFALLLAVDRRIPENVACLRAHKWNKKEFSKADGIFGKTLGVIGAGQIGREVITRAKAFGMPVVAWSRSLTREKAQRLGVTHCAEIEEVFRCADVLTVHLALKPQTAKLVNAARLALMKPNAIFINTSRGEVVDQAALAAAVKAGKIRAGLDVFDPEPSGPTGDFQDPILALPGLYGTHHIGASTEQAQEAIAEEAIRIIETFVKTGVVLNCVNLASRTPAKWQLVVRHFDRVGVLAFVMDQVRRAGINLEEVQNVIFDGAAAASCRIQMDVEPSAELLASLQAGNPDIIGLELLRIGE